MQKDKVNINSCVSGLSPLVPQYDNVTTPREQQRISSDHFQVTVWKKKTRFNQVIIIKMTALTNTLAGCHINLSRLLYVKSNIQCHADQKIPLML